MAERKIKLDRSNFKPLSEASHTIGLNGRKIGPNNPSEWCWTWASLQFPVGTKVSKSEFRAKLIEALHYECLSKMIDDGEALLVLDKDGDLACLIVGKGAE